MEKRGVGLKIEAKESRTSALLNPVGPHFNWGSVLPYPSAPTSRMHLFILILVLKVTLVHWLQESDYKDCIPCICYTVPTGQTPTMSGPRNIFHWYIYNQARGVVDAGKTSTEPESEKMFIKYVLSPSVKI